MPLDRLEVVQISNFKTASKWYENAIDGDISTVSATKNGAQRRLDSLDRREDLLPIALWPWLIPL